MTTRTVERKRKRLNTLNTVNADEKEVFERLMMEAFVEIEETDNSRREHGC